MKYLAAYLLLVNGGNAKPSAKDIKQVLTTIGVESEDSRVEALLKDLEGKTVEELIAEGSAKLASGLPSGGSASASSGAGAAAGGAAAEEAEEEKAESEAEESDDDMGFGLFD